ncbi:hypothetical protein SAMN04487762_1821 [Polaribacter sp. Hel1_33_78]|jgi:hypothetical protein|uniref:hypothetical protein n=1 Tax=uncultured Polaribacter sp. TaxID=174711 RepID=UPI00056AB8C8|nr:hypothetical protein [uncultured Polaribacter sp.]MBT3742307.1 hypothetical protein [Polaribacter sp.]PKV64552.1 hypothetical protein ATE90_0944 [Polaribacter sp. Hel1_33_96]SDU10432.1 hypothetical protein SAMN04487762_1821 [Polaribacter sp. Hel1_33_78]
MVIFLLPLTINSIHDFLNHEHAVCSSKTNQHIHKKDIDCSLHLIKQSVSFLASNHYKILTKTVISNDDSIQYSFLKNHYRLSFYLRGPPLYVQA